MGIYSPTLGIIGAVLGLMAVMQNLADPSKLGHGIAAAFTATVYGIGLANLFFLPIAGKLEGHRRRADPGSRNDHRRHRVDRARRESARDRVEAATDSSTSQLSHGQKAQTRRSPQTRSLAIPLAT
jgi:hypothetical protein